MIRQAACQSVIIYIFIKIPVTSFYTHSFNNRVFFRFNPKPENNQLRSLFLYPQWPNRKWTLTSLWNVKITVDDGEIKIFELNQKPPHMPPHSQTSMDHPGEGENREEEMKLQQQERETLSVLGTRVRLSGGFGTAAGPDLTRAGTVPQAWPGRRPASGRWREKKGFRIRSAFQI